MSEFSDLLSLLIKSRDVNVSALTGYCELDRSTMYKLINGKRAPSSREQVQKIAEFINLNPLETKELMTAYLITKTGSEVYYRRQNVVKFILDFQEIQRISSFHSIDVSQFRLPLAADEQNTYPLTISFSSVLDVHLKNLPMFLTETSHIYGLSAEPCLLPLLTGDMLERYVVKDLPNRQSLILMLKKYLDSVSSSNLHNYFSKEGVLSFMETGKLHECPKDLYTPLSMPDRIYLLKKYREQLLSGKNFRLFGEVLDKFPSNLHLYTSMGYGYMVFSDCSGHLLYLVLKEQNLLTAFYDFSHSLKECSMICSQEETADFLQNIILQYSRRMTSATKITRQAGTSF